MTSPGKAGFTVNVDPWINQTLEKYARHLGVSKNFLCVQALKDFISKLPPIETAQINITIVEGD